MTLAEYSWGNFTVNEEGFSRKKRSFSFAEISCLEFRWDTNQGRAGSIPAPLRSTAELRIYLKRRRPILLRFNGRKDGDGVADTRRRARQLFLVYDMLSRFSFEYRIGKYIEQLDEHGCFLYDDKQFYPDGTVVDGRRRTNVFYREVIKRTGMVVIQIPHRHGFAGGLGKLVGRDPNIYIKIRYDEDCLYGLLRSLYGIFWR